VFFEAVATQDVVNPVSLPSFFILCRNFVLFDSVLEGLSWKINDAVVYFFHLLSSSQYVSHSNRAVNVASYPFIVAQGGWSASEVALRGI
jgi:hypothetical protein